jgi:hypothetical protein
MNFKKGKFTLYVGCVRHLLSFVPCIITFKSQNLSEVMRGEETRWNFSSYSKIPVVGRIVSLQKIY